MFYKIIPLAFVIHMGRCSVILDTLSQRGIHVSDYCPKMKYCPEGAHVMCMYYDPERLMGPRCSNPKNVSINQELANKLLEVSNAVRSKIALGKEKGKDGIYLPRGYGMFRLKWDSELATFAQVLANQCVLRHDLCRATKRFPDPGQTAGLVRFSYPDWYPVSKSAHFTTPGMNTPKLFYAITQALKSWYGQKNFVTAEMITNYPDWSLNPNNQAGRLYLEMVYGPATHMGCGMSAYTEYAYYDNNAALNYNSVQIICNYSSRPRQHNAVYNTTQPTTPGFTSRCGCPDGSDEDTDCLCQESNKIPTTPKQFVTRKCAKGDGNCDPTVVLLPIFTVEDAPPHKLHTLYRNINDSIIDKNTLETFDYYENADSRNKVPKKQTHNYKLSNSRVNLATSRPVKKQVSRRKQIKDVKNRYFNRNTMVSSSDRSSAQSRGTASKHVATQRKQSVFTRVPTFELPYRRKQILNVDKFNNFKKDVNPRKNFDSTQELFNRYRKKIGDPFKKNSFSTSKHTKTVSSNLSVNDIHGNEDATETVLHTAEDKVIDSNKNFLLQNNTKKETTSSNEATDNKLLRLLDSLERAVKNIKLHGAEKEIFDAKIRKIYEKVVGKPVDWLGYDNKLEHDDIDLMSDNETHRKKYDTTKTDMSDKFLDDDFDKKNIAKNPNSIRGGDIHKENKKDFNHDRFCSDEYSLYPRYAEDLKPRTVYKNNLDTNDYNGGLVHRDNRRRNKKYTEYNTKDDVLSPSRRKYYQDKLDRLERKLHNSRNIKHRSKHERQRGVRPMRPTEDIHMQTKSKTQMEDPFYPERARFLHGF